MKVLSIFREEGKLPHSVRLCAKVQYADTPLNPETYWYDVDKSLASFFSASGNPWVAALLPLAVTLKEPLEIPLPVDSLLLENIQGLMHIWKRWYPRCAVVPVEAEVASPPRASAAVQPFKAVAFYSGGVDSSYTLWSTRSDPELRTGDMLFVWGFEVPTRNVAAFRKLFAQLKRVAEEFGRKMVFVATNLKETRLRQAGWAELFHGPATISTALALEKRYRRVLIPSTHSQDYLEPWGSHPHTDPLWSTSQLQVIHHGTEFNRVQKTAAIVDSDAILGSLHVCIRSFTEENCCACTKCYRTMMALELLGVLDRCPTFHKQPLQTDRIPYVYSARESDEHFLEEVASLARAVHREDIADAIHKSFRRSRRLRKAMHFADVVNHMPFLWRLSRPLERLIQRHSIT